MSNIRHMLLPLFIAALMLSAAPAHADPKPWIWSWWESHWRNQDFIPYLENGKHPHNTQWDRSAWTPEDWIAQRADGVALVEGFYKADIIRKQYMHDDVPIMVVGPSFYMLGGQDKRRVTETVDHVWKITSSAPNGMFMLYDWRTKKAIGSYTRDGLQIQ